MNHSPSSNYNIQTNTGNRIRIFVDGENFRKTIQGLFPNEEKSYLPQRADWQSFFENIAYSALPGELQQHWLGLEPVHWYVAGDVYIPGHLKDGKMRGFSRKMKKSFENRRLVHKRIASQCPKITFEEEGFFSLASHGLGQEKGVDMALGRDLLRYFPHYDIAVLVSGDADFEPVIRSIHSAGKRVVNVEYIEESGRVLPGNAPRLRKCVDGTIRVPYDRMSQYMGYANIPVVRDHSFSTITPV